MTTLISLTRTHKHAALIILATAAVLFFRVSYVDMVGDDAHYTVRSLGYVDMMFSDKQTTPLNWFDTYPMWANLSFHDHPPLLFFIQHIFLRIHESIFFAKLPYILFTLGTLIVVYRWMDTMYGRKTALWSLGFLSTNTLFIWVGRTAYLEAGVIFFSVLSLWAFSFFLKDTRKWVWLGLAVGMAFLSKYTSFFLVPTMLGIVALRYRFVFKQKEFYFAVLTAFLVFSPSIIYNIAMYGATGHFDLQFSRLFGITAPWTYPGVTGYLLPPHHVFIALGQFMGYPYVVIALGALAYTCVKKKELLIVCSAIIWLTVEFCLIGTSSWYLSMFAPFFAISLGYAAAHISSKRYIGFSAAISSALLLYGAFLVVNSNMLVKTVGSHVGWITSLAVGKNVGVYQLDKYLDQLIDENDIFDIRDGYAVLKKKKGSLAKYGTSERAKALPPALFEHMIIYDENINWFTELWPLLRRRFYHNLPILSSKEYLQYADSIIIKDVYFIKATDMAYTEGASIWSDVPAKIEGLLKDKDASFDSIHRLDGQEVFRIYHFRQP